MSPHLTKTPDMPIPTDHDMCAVDGSDMGGLWSSGLGGRSDLDQDSESQEFEDYAEDEWGSSEGSDKDMEYEWRTSEESNEGMEADNQMEMGPGVDEGNDNAGDAESETEEEVFMKRLFSPVLAQIRLDIIPEFVVFVRQFYDEVERGVWGVEPTIEEPDDGEPNGYDEERDSSFDEQDWEIEDKGESSGNPKNRHEIDSVIVGSPIFGDLHVVFPLEFPDGIKWALKVPANGTPGIFDEVSKSALFSEALTMILLGRETTIPLPEVFRFEANCENELRCPFILMEFIPGKSLSEFWCRETSSGASLRGYRSRILKDISEAMTQLDQFSFDEGGFLNFNKSNGKLEGIGSLRVVKHRASIDKETITGGAMPTFVKAGPFDDPELFFKEMIRHHRRPTSKLGKGALELFKKFLSEIPDPEERSSFVLAHPNLDFENIIVSERGEIQGFIGWTNVCSVPRCIGNESYPWWLLDDYLSDGFLDNDHTKFDPSSLNYYRGLYNQYMIPTFSQKRAFSLTQNSHISLSLYAAALNPEDTIAILSNLFDEMINISLPPPGNLGFKDTCYALHGRYLTEKQRDYLNTAVEQLVEPVRCNLYRTNSLKKWFDRDWPEPHKPPFPYLN